METPTPQMELNCVVAVAGFLERGPGAESMEHLDWNCFLNSFFLACIFSHILTFLKMPWPKAVKMLYY